jgi:PilZ domain
MVDRRTEPRMLCADLVDVQWKDKTGRIRKSLAHLEDISLSGACIQVEVPVPIHTVIKIAYPKGGLLGTVRYCVYREIGYFLGIEFEAGSRWSQRQFKPQHLLDPRRLVIRSVNRTRLMPEAELQ